MEQNETESVELEVTEEVITLTKEEEKHIKRMARKEKRATKRAKRKARPLWMKITKALMITVLLVIVASIGWHIGLSVVNAYLIAQVDEISGEEVPSEELADIAPLDIEGQKRIDALPTYDEQDTWAVYLYMCGSDLEDSGIDELSDITKYLTEQINEQYKVQQEAERSEMIHDYIDNLNEHGLDLPKVMYAPKDRTDEDKKEDTPESAPGDYGMATHDLIKMSRVDLPDNVQVIIQTGGSKRWQTSLANPNRSNILLYNNKGFNQIEDNPIRNMGDPSTLSDFMTYCEENFPADHKMLIIYNHGGGTGGACWDSVYGDDNLTLNEFSEAFSTVYGEEPEEKPYELIAFNACLMSNLDVVKVVAPYGKYFAGGEEALTFINRGNGKYFLLEGFEKYKELNGAKIAMVAADSYANFWARMGKNNLLNKVYDKTVSGLSVLDLDKVNELYDAYDALMDRVLAEAVNNPGSMTEVARAAGRSYRYGYSDSDIFNLIDLGLFVDGLENTYPEEVIRIQKALDDCVLYKRSTYEEAQSKGITVYFPIEVKREKSLRKALSYINEVSKSDSTRAFYYYKIAGCLNDEFENYIKDKGLAAAKVVNTQELNKLSKQEVTISENGYSIEANMPEMEYVQDCTFGLSKYNEDEEIIEYLGTSTNASLGDDGLLETYFTGRWITLDGHVLPIEIIGRENGMSRYRSRVKIDGYKEYYLMLGVNDETLEINLLGLADCNEEFAPDMVGRINDTLTEGCKITPIYEYNSIAEGDNSNTISTKEGDTFKYKLNSKFAVDEVEDGTYFTAMVVTDLRGDSYSSAVVQMEIKGGKVTEKIIRDDMFNEVNY